MHKKELERALKNAWASYVHVEYRGTETLKWGELRVRSSRAEYFYKAASEFCAADVFAAERAIRKAAIKAAVARIGLNALSDRAEGERYPIRSRCVVIAGGAVQALEALREVAAEHGYSPTQEWRDLVNDLIEAAGLAK